MADDVRLLLVSFIVENLDVLEFSLELIAEPMVSLGNRRQKTVAESVKVANENHQYTG